MIVCPSTSKAWISEQIPEPLMEAHEISETRIETDRDAYICMLRQVTSGHFNIYVYRH